MNLTINLTELLSSYTLKQDENYTLYTCDNGVWRNTYGFVCKTKDAEKVATLALEAYADPTVIGVWISLESDDGVIDHTIIQINKQ